MVLTEGQAHDSPLAIDLLKSLGWHSFSTVLGDKGYDADATVQWIEEKQGQAVIPPKRNRHELRAYDKEAYKRRNVVERLFGRLKQYRRVATRYEKTARNYRGMVLFASCFIMMSPSLA